MVKKVKLLKKTANVPDDVSLGDKTGILLAPHLPENYHFFYRIILVRFIFGMR